MFNMLAHTFVMPNDSTREEISLYKLITTFDNDVHLFVKAKKHHSTRSHGGCPGQGSGWTTGQVLPRDQGCVSVGSWGPAVTPQSGVTVMLSIPNLKVIHRKTENMSRLFSIYSISLEKYGDYSSV